MFASAMPHSKNRSGNSLAKYVVIVDLERSASQTTTSLFSRPSSTSALPKASRVATPSFSSYFVRRTESQPALSNLLQREFHFLLRGSDAVIFRVVLHE